MDNNYLGDDCTKLRAELCDNCRKSGNKADRINQNEMAQYHAAGRAAHRQRTLQEDTIDLGRRSGGMWRNETSLASSPGDSRKRSYGDLRHDTNYQGFQTLGNLRVPTTQPNFAGFDVPPREGFPMRQTGWAAEHSQVIDDWGSGLSTDLNSDARRGTARSLAPEPRERLALTNQGLFTQPTNQGIFAQPTAGLRPGSRPSLADILGGGPIQNDKDA
ncbi:MAG: hypothetical protein Q9170_005983 [Blastenia crenularia]